MVGHVFLFNPAIRAASEYIDKGEVGQLKYVSMTRTNLGPVRLDVNAAWDLAGHDISIANYWLGGRPIRYRRPGGAGSIRGCTTSCSQRSDTQTTSWSISRPHGSTRASGD